MTVLEKLKQMSIKNYSLSATYFSSVLKQLLCNLIFALVQTVKIVNTRATVQAPHQTTVSQSVTKCQKVSQSSLNIHLEMVVVVVSGWWWVDTNFSV